MKYWYSKRLTRTGEQLPQQFKRVHRTAEWVTQEKTTDILECPKNSKFGRVRQVPIRELGWEFPGWDLSHFAKFGIFMGIL